MKADFIHIDVNKLWELIFKQYLFKQYLELSSV